MPGTMRSLFTPEFLQRVADGEESELLSLLAENSLHQFFPSAPILITHGTIDTVAPFFNGENYASAARNAGRSVEFIPLEGINHFDGIYHWGLHTMNWLGN